MSKKINLYWYNLNVGHGNFGDELNHYLVSRLSGSKVNQVFILSKGFEYIYKSLSLIYSNVVTFRDYPRLLTQFFLKDYIVGIGSVISLPNSPKARIWGSGIIKKDDKINEALFYAVRGKYTQKRIRELGFIVPDTIGDPALLLPLVYSCETSKKYEIGIIPHHIHYQSVKEKIQNNAIKVINLTDPIEKIVNEINSCKLTISTSLHGIIVSHAYKVPSLWFTFNGQNLAGDNIKFYDYFSSVGIKEYLPFKIGVNEFVSFNYMKLSLDNKTVSIPTNIKTLQRGLINSAPFVILDKYKNF